MFFSLVKGQHIHWAAVYTAKVVQKEIYIVKTESQRFINIA